VKVSAEKILNEGLFNKLHIVVDGNTVTIIMREYVTGGKYVIKYEVGKDGTRKIIHDSGVDLSCLKYLRYAYRRARLTTHL